jgi:hypothetical protein
VPLPYLLSLISLSSFRHERHFACLRQSMLHYRHAVCSPAMPMPAADAFVDRRHFAAAAAILRHNDGATPLRA